MRKARKDARKGEGVFERPDDLKRLFEVLLSGLRAVPAGLDTGKFDEGTGLPLEIAMPLEDLQRGGSVVVRRFELSFVPHGPSAHEFQPSLLYAFERTQGSETVLDGCLGA